MGSKVYKGQEVMVEGSLSGETVIVTKFAYDRTLSLEYLGEAKFGSAIELNKWFITKFEYDRTLSVENILQAINQMTAGATRVSIDVTSSDKYVIITLPNNGDFREVNPLDEISVKTLNNTLNIFPIWDTDRDQQVRIRKLDIPANILATLVNETNTKIKVGDILLRLNHDSTKELNKRRWDLRERYIYE